MKASMPLPKLLFTHTGPHLKKGELLNKKVSVKGVQFQYL